MGGGAIVIERALAELRDRYWQSCRFADYFARGIQNRRDHAHVPGALPVILHLGADFDGRRPRLHYGRCQRAPLLHVNRGGFDGPDVAVKAGALIEPAVAQGGVHAHQQHIWDSRVYKVAQVEAEWIVTAAVPADVVTVENHHGIPVSAVELHRDAPARIGRRDFEEAAYQPTLVSG